MRKSFFTKWFLLAALLAISFTAFSVVAYKETRSICSSQRPDHFNEGGLMLWDMLSRQFSAISAY
jgi:hypothetical protein